MAPRGSHLTEEHKAAISARLKGRITTEEHRENLRRGYSGVRVAKPYVWPRKLIAKEYVMAVKERTFCAVCGKQPIDWHSPRHDSDNSLRIARLVNSGATIERIQAEIDQCTPLCRSCHMREDGRTERLLAACKAAGLYDKKPPKPCTACSRLYKPLRRGLCNTCDKQRNKRVGIMEVV